VKRGVVRSGLKERVVYVFACGTGLSHTKEGRVRASFVLAFTGCRGAGDASGG
jgi:hypothetical protein